MGYKQRVIVRLAKNKKIRKVVVAILVALLVLILLPFVLINIKPVQTFIVDKITLSISEKIGTKVTVEDVYLKFFYNIALNGIYFEDLNQDTLIYSDRIEVGFSPLKIFEKMLDIDYVGIDKAFVNIKVDSHGQANISILKKLLNKEKQNDDDWAVTLNFDDIKIKDSRLYYRDERHGLSATSRALDTGNICLEDIDGRFVVDKLQKNYYQGRIKSLSLKEHFSGIRLKNIQTGFLITSNEIKVDELFVSLSNSRLSTDNILLQFDDIGCLKDSLPNTRIQLQNFVADISTKDVSRFFASVPNLRHNIHAELSAEGKLNDLNVLNLHINYNEQLGIKGNLKTRGFYNIEDIYVVSNNLNIYGNTLSVQDLISAVNKKPYVFPYEILSLDRLSYLGKVSGYLGDLQIIGDLKTKIGDIQTSVNLKSSPHFENMTIEGLLKTEGLNLSHVMRNKNIGSIVLDAYTKIKVARNAPIESNVDANIKEFVYNGYKYENISLHGDIAKNKFEGNLRVDDNNGKLNFHGLVDVSDPQAKMFFFETQVRGLNMNKLKLIEKYPDLVLDFNIRSDFTGDNIDNLNGSIFLDSILLTNKGGYHIDKIHLSSNSKNDSLTTIIESDFINGFVSGRYSYKTLPGDLMSIVQKSVPAISNASNSIVGSIKSVDKNTLGFYFEINRLKELCEVLEIDIYTTKRSTISGFYNGEIGMGNIFIDVPQFVMGERIFNSTSLNCYNNYKDLNLIISTTMKMVQDSMLIAIKSNCENNEANLFLAWKNFNEENVVAGEIITKNKFYLDKDSSLNLTVNIFPTQLVSNNNTTLNVNNSTIQTNFKKIKINQFSITGQNQSITIDGIVSASEYDRLNINLKKLDMGFVSSFLPSTSAISFGGILSGSVIVSRTFNRPIIEADVMSNNFMFNGSALGRFQASSNLNNYTNSIDFFGVLEDEKTSSLTTIDGGYYFAKDSLVLNGDATNLRIQFLDKFISKIFSETDGYGTGKVKVYGNLKKRRLVVETKAYVRNGVLNLPVLGTKFYFSDTITMTRDSILFKNIDIADRYGNKGKIDGYLSYKYFDDLKYKIDINCKEMLIFEKQDEQNTPLYGRAYATGYGTIVGKNGKTNINCNMVTESNTKIFIPLDNTNASTYSNFVSFVDFKNDTIGIDKRKKLTYEGNNTEVNLNLDVRPNAQLQLILDRRSGDMIKAVGNGTMRISYNTQTGDLQMLGNYTLVDSKYLFTFQQALEREFEVLSGSSLVWNGSPQNPNVDLKAIYETKASIKGIFDEAAILSSYSSSNIPVHCVLSLTGELMHPDISFDLELPNSDDNIRRALSNMLATEEMLNRQILYLLAFNRFYNPNQQSGSPSGGQSGRTQNDVLAIVTSTVGSQLNNMLSQISDKWSIGVNIKLDENQAYGTRNNEYGVNINYSPNDRIAINSNLGYRDEEVAGGASQQDQNNALSNAILDFEIEYKLNESGQLVANVYNRTNSIQDFKDAPYTQGIGIKYRESFSSVKQLLDKFRKKKKGNKKKKNEEDNQEKMVEKEDNEEVPQK